MVIFDTDIFIWFFRGDQNAWKLINDQDVIAISIVSYMEIIQGARDKSHLRRLQQFLKSELACEIFPVSEIIGERAAFYIESYTLSHHLMLADALIVATAVEHSLPLYSSNAKHFRMIPELDLRIFHPDDTF